MVRGKSPQLTPHLKREVIVKRFLLLFTVLILSIDAQSLVKTIPLPAVAYYNSAYGLVYANGKLWISSGSSATGNKGKLIGMDTLGNVVDSIQIDYPTIRESQGLAWDGTHFWYNERLTSRHNFRKVTTTGSSSGFHFNDNILYGWHSI
jgi:hypothetical protein